MIEPGNVVVVTDKEVITHSGFAAHEFIRAVIMERAGVEYTDDFAKTVKSMGKEKKRVIHPVTMRRDHGGPDIRDIGDMVFYGEMFE